MRRYLTVSAVSLIALVFPTTAQAAVGDLLDKFIPSPGGDGRAITVRPGSTTAYYTTQTSLEDIRMVNLANHEYQGRITTDLPSLPDGNHSFGALAWSPDGSTLWGSEYDANNGRIDTINTGNGAVTRVFDAIDEDAAIVGIDGLAVDGDGSLWLSEDGLNQSLADGVIINRYNSTGTRLGFFTVPFGNSGIAVDGDDLWLADIDTKTIHKYTKGGTDTGVSFSTPADVSPEGLAIDNCTFAGKKVLWTHSADTGAGPMAAFEIGTSTNSGCPAIQPPQTPPQGPDTITIGDGTNRPIYAGQPIWLDATSPYDPSGTIFIYIWLFSDYSYNINKPKVTPTLNDTVQDKGKVQHTFDCAGFYAPKVTVIDQTGARKEVSKELTVQFSKKATKKHGSLQVSPNLVASETRAKINLKAKKLKKKKGRTKIKSILYKLDGKKLGKRKKPKKAVIAKIKRAGPHTLQVDVKFKGPRGKKRIKECFQLS